MRTLSKIQIKILALVLIVAFPFSAYGADGQIKIGQTASTTFPIIISQSGSYVLTSDLNVPSDKNGFEINSDNVTLDLNGHSIIGQGSGSGIDTNAFNITIKDGTVSNFWSGILADAGYTVIRNIQASNNGTGIDADGPATIINCIASNNNIGINANNAVVTNCIAVSNGGNGINANVSTITNCTVNFNNGDGIDANSCTITNCTFRYNFNDGIVAANSTINTCTILGNQGIGIDARSCLINNCNILGNLTDGVDANKCTITNCSISDNHTNNIHAHFGNRIEGNNLRNAANYGLLIDGSANYIIKNVASTNPSGNFQDNGSNNYMPICGVDATDNCNYGF